MKAKEQKGAEAWSKTRRRQNRRRSAWETTWAEENTEIGEKVMLKKKWMSLIALALASVMLLSACAKNGGNDQKDNNDDGGGTSTGGEVVKDANELVIGTYMPVTTLVPWKTTSDGDGYILRQIYHTCLLYTSPSPRDCS